MNSAEFLKQLSAQGVRLWVEGDRLRYRAPEGALTPAVLGKLRQQKAEILELLYDSPAPPPTEQSEDTSSVHPLSHGQQALWFLHESAPESPAYNVAFTARIRSEVDRGALNRTCQRLTSRHPSLRCTFPMRDGQPVQEVRPEWGVIEEIDASGWSSQQLKEQVVQSYQRPFDLQRGPVMRVGLFTRSPDDHVLLLTIHHVACDGWSLWTLQDEFRRLYTDHVSGEAASLSQPGRTYWDFVDWQSKMLFGPIGQRHWSYWREQLSGQLPVLDLPTDRPRPPAQTYRGASFPFRLSEELTGRLKELAQSAGATLYMTLLAAFHVLLHRYSSQEDILVGSPMAGRGQTEYAGVVGYFVNSVVMRGRFWGNPTFREFLEQVRNTVLAALEHQDYPFSLLVERLRPKRDLGRSPIFSVSFALQKAQLASAVSDLLAADEEGITVKWGSLKLEPFEIAQEEGQFDLTLDTVESKRALRGVFKYRTDLFQSATIERMLEHFRNLLEGIVDDADRPVSSLPLLGESERKRLLLECNNTEREFPDDKCIQQLFEAQAERTPQAPAVVFEDQQLTYGELNQRANQLAHYLRKQGVGLEVLVGICLERSLEMVVGILGILKAGGAYLPLDPDYPEKRLDFMIRDSRAPLLLTSSQLAEALPRSSARVVCFDDPQSPIGEQSRSNPVCRATADNLAYVLYTSGSTGQPKGVAIEHRGLCNMALALGEAHHVTAGQRVLQFASSSFDASVEELFSTLVSGAVLCLGRREEMFPGAGLIRLLREHRVNVATLPPSVLAALPSELLPDLHTLIAAGEACSGEVVRRWGRGRRFINAYGPTEATVCATLRECREEQTRPPIGRPIANTKVYVLDSRQQLLPIGVPGELCISGVGLAREYLNQPELTANRFVLNPFSDDPKSRLYRTGDRCRRLADGELEFLGRIDHQVKLRGFRIELGEIEAVLDEHPAIQQSAVTARQESSGDKHLVGYLAVNGQLRPTISTLRSFLRTKLPDYMIPSTFMFLESLPLTDNGKVDRDNLPAPERSRPELDRPYVAPRTRTERLLADAWIDVLGIEKVGVHDDFFDLGGASVKSLRIIAKAEEAGLSLNPDLLKPELLFEYPTIAELAAVIEGGQPQRSDTR